MNALRKTAEQKVSAGASKQVAKPRRSKDRHAMPILIQRRGRTQAGLACQMGAGPFSERRKLGWDYSGRSITRPKHNLDWKAEIALDFHLKPNRRSF